MISKRAAALGAVVIILITAITSSFVTGKVYEFNAIMNGDTITAEDFADMKDFYKKISQVRSVIEDQYIEEPDMEEMLTEAIKGMVASLEDPYTYYMTAEEYQKFVESFQGSYAGIGISVTVTPEDNLITVVNVFKDSPAFEAGVESQDKIIAINGEEMDGSMLDIAISIMRGEPGSTVEVTFLREQEVLNLEIERQIIQFPDLEYRMVEDNIGYIWLYRFDESASKNFEKAVNDLIDQGMKGLILDLRSNPGGALPECEAIADMLLPEGLILYSEDRHGNRENYTSGPEHLGIPLALIVNELSASASEVLAGAVQDHGAGTVIGTTTFGKGLVQTIRRFTEGDVIKLTTSKYFTPNGRDINNKGVVPDIEIEMTEEAREFIRENRGEDLPLELDAPLLKALDVIKEKLE